MKRKPLLDAVLAVATEAPPASVFRRWTLGLLGISLAILTIIGATVAVVDPLMQYHKPWFGLQSVMWKEDFLNPGLARHWPHDASVVGGSFIQNTRVSELKDLFGLNAIKLTNSGGSVPRIHELMRVALESGQPQKAIFVSLPMDRVARDVSTAAAFDGPVYLYDTNPLNDIGYWLNIDVAIHIADLAKRMVLGSNKEKKDSEWFDDAYSWYSKYKNRFSKQYILQHYFAPVPREMKPRDPFVTAADKVIDEYVLPLVKAHPETTFYFIQPPHSRLLFRDAYVNGNLEGWLAAYQRFCDRLLPFSNVRLFNFMNYGSYSDDLNNYKDRSHYKTDANSMMFADMASDRYRVWTTPTQAELEALLFWARDYEDPDIPVHQAGIQGAVKAEVDDAAQMAADQEVQF